MKKFLILFASASLLVLTSCGTKKAEPTVVPIYNTPPANQQTPNQGQYQQTPSQTNQPSYTTPSSTRTPARKKYTAQTTIKKTTTTTTYQTSSSQQQQYEPYPGYTSDFKGAYPQIIYNYLAAPGQHYQPGYPSYPTYPSYDFYDRTAPYNSVNAPR